MPIKSDAKSKKNYQGVHKGFNQAAANQRKPKKIIRSNRNSIKNSPVLPSIINNKSNRSASSVCLQAVLKKDPKIQQSFRYLKPDHSPCKNGTIQEETKESWQIINSTSKKNTKQSFHCSSDKITIPRKTSLRVVGAFEQSPQRESFVWGTAKTDRLQHEISHTTPHQPKATQRLKIKKSQIFFEKVHSKHSGCKFVVNPFAKKPHFVSKATPCKKAPLFDSSFGETIQKSIEKNEISRIMKNNGPSEKFIEPESLEVLILGN